MNKSVVNIWALALITISLSLISYKVFVVGLPLGPNQHAEVWTVQATLRFEGVGKPAKVDFYIPDRTPGFVRIDEDFVSGKYGLSINQDSERRKSEWAVRRSDGEQVLYYRVSLTRAETDVVWDEEPIYPEPLVYDPPYAEAVEALVDEVRKNSADIASFTNEMLGQLNTKNPNENIKLLKTRSLDDGAWTNEIVGLLSQARIPARIIWGVFLNDGAKIDTLSPMLQVHNGDSWLSYNPLSSAQGWPENFLAWHIGDTPLVELTGGKQLGTRFAIKRSYAEVVDVVRRNSQLSNLPRIGLLIGELPVQTQLVYELLLMLPLGALVVVFMRTIIGVQTFGTFMPILIALAFRETQLFWGLLVFSIIVGIGIALRMFLEKLHLLLVPRLASILVIVVILLLLTSTMTHQFGFDRLLSISLFPIVIIAMMIERVSIVWEESGTYDASVQALGSLVVATAGYLLMTNEHLSYLMFVFPELLLMILAACLWMGRYTGYRVSELIRFRDFPTQ